MDLSANNTRRLFNLYAPYLGAGVKITQISSDWSEARVEMAVRWYNRNIVGTHFGGSLYSMIDPHLMMLLMRRLGKDYYVWDKSAEIEFVKATKRKVSSVISITQEQVDTIKQHTSSGDKYFPEFWLEIRDSNNDLIANVKKVLYVKKKPHKR